MLEVLAAVELSCTDINRIASRVIIIDQMTHQQKVEVVQELQKTNPNCKVEVVIK
jgi:hypothetical protein